MRYAVIDTETTGVGHGTNGRVVQYAHTIYENGRPIKHYSTYIDPRKNGKGKVIIPKQAERVHGIGWRKILREKRRGKAPTMREAKRQIQKDLKGCKKVYAYNAQFDVRMMKENGCAVDRGRKVECVMLMANKHLGRGKLEVNAKKLGIKTKTANFHDARTDIDFTHKMLQKLKKRFKA